jgi:histidine decarboxylase
VTATDTPASPSPAPAAGPASAADPGPASQPAIQADLDRLLIDLTQTTAIGFPAASDVDYTPLAPFLGFLLNNLGDPAVDGDYPHHTKPQEREVVDTVADLLRAPKDDRWGYVTGGATEGTEQALYLARTRHPGAVVYYSQAAHHSTANVAERLAMPSVTIRADTHGEIDYGDLAGQVEQRRDRPAVVVANVGTPLAEAIDDVRRLTAVLDQAAVTRRWIHADAALSGIPLALLDPDARPGFDIADGADSIVVSGHKFLGSPVPCAVLVVVDSRRPYGARTATYTGCPDSTLTNSRSGLAVLTLWYALRCYGIEGLRARAERSRDLAAYAHGRLVEIGWPAHRQPHAFTVTLATPPPAVTATWALPRRGGHSGHSHIVCMPGIGRGHIDAFIADLQATTTTTTTSGTTAAAAVAAATDPAEPPGNGQRRLLRRSRRPEPAQVG